MSKLKLMYIGPKKGNYTQRKFLSLKESKWFILNIIYFWFDINICSLTINEYMNKKNIWKQ